jgi:hypothetical protein
MGFQNPAVPTVRGKQCERVALIQISKTMHAMAVVESQFVNAGKSSKIFMLTWANALKEKRLIDILIRTAITNLRIVDGRRYLNRITINENANRQYLKATPWGAQGIEVVPSYN